jgi:hypothetical protein
MAKSRKRGAPSNIALDASKQKQFNQTVQRIQKDVCILIFKVKFSFSNVIICLYKTLSVKSSYFATNFAKKIYLLCLANKSLILNYFSTLAYLYHKPGNWSLSSSPLAQTLLESDPNP